MDFDYTTSAVYASDTPPSIIHGLSIITKYDIPDLISVPLNLDFDGDLPQIISSLIASVNHKFVKCTPIGRDLFIEFERFLISVIVARPMTKMKRYVRTTLYGSIDDVTQINSILEKKYPFEKKNNVDWVYLTDKDIQRSTIKLKHDHTALDEFFPWIKPNLEAFQQQYIDSSANILVLIGDPGTGKTSFVRDFIARHDLSAAVTYDEELMKRDSFFVDFMNKPYDLLVVEDADVILRDRDSGNKIMNKLLNASDGLIETKKKIIFTANLTSLDEIDPALIRPGRCFEALIFRSWTAQEAKIAAEAAGLPDPQERITLSRLFSNGHSAEVKPSMGFHVR